MLWTAAFTTPALRASLLEEEGRDLVLSCSCQEDAREAGGLVEYR